LIVFALVVEQDLSPIARKHMKPLAHNGLAIQLKAVPEAIPTMNEVDLEHRALIHRLRIEKK